MDSDFNCLARLFFPAINPGFSCHAEVSEFLISLACAFTWKYDPGRRDITFCDIGVICLVNRVGFSGWRVNREMYDPCTYNLCTACC